MAERGFFFGTRVDTGTLENGWMALDRDGKSYLTLELDESKEVEVFPLSVFRYGCHDIGSGGIDWWLPRLVGGKTTGSGVFWCGYGTTMWWLEDNDGVAVTCRGGGNHRFRGEEGEKRCDVCDERLERFVVARVRREKERNA